MLAEIIAILIFVLFFIAALAFSEI